MKVSPSIKQTNKQTNKNKQTKTNKNKQYVAIKIWLETCAL